LVYAVKEMLTTGARVIIDRRGVLDKRIGMGVISWEDISGVYTTNLNNVPHVCLEVINEKKYLADRSIVTVAALKFHKYKNNISPFSINAGVLDTSADEIYNAIMEWREYYSVRGAQVPEAEVVV